MMQLTDNERTWLTAKWRLVREFQMEADKAAEKWSAMSQAFDQWCREMHITDAVQIADRKSNNLELNGYLSSWDWFRREAERHMHDIQTFKAMKEMGAL